MRYRMICIGLVLVVALGLTACRDDGGDGGTATAPAVEATATVGATATVRASATPEATPTATATPEPEAAVEAVSQSLDEEGALVASRVFAPVDGWLAVYGDEGGEWGELLGATAIEQGESNDVMVTVDPFLVTEQVTFVLHGEEEDADAFDAAQDAAIEVDGEPVAAQVSVELLVTAPGLQVADQPLGEDSHVTLEEVRVPADGWVAVHRDEAGEAGEVLGVTRVEAGAHENVAVRIDWRHATQPLHAVLYTDNGEMGRFEPDGGDETVTLRGEVVQAAFVVEGPPDIYVLNQPIVTTELVIERVFVNEAAWVLVYSNFEGLTDRVLGHAAVEAGENLTVTVPINAQNTTDILHVQLHSDGGGDGEFANVVDDPPVLGADGQAVRVSIETDMGNYLVTRDQALGEDGEIVVPLVVSDLDTWVVVWSAAPDATGTTAAPGETEEQGEIIGQTLIERGVQRDVVVAISGAQAGDTVYVVLHRDAGEAGVFEFPGPDEILRRERTVILSPVTLE